MKNFGEFCEQLESRDGMFEVRLVDNRTIVGMFLEEEQGQVFWYLYEGRPMILRDYMQVQGVRSLLGDEASPYANDIKVLVHPYRKPGRA